MRNGSIHSIKSLPATLGCLLLTVSLPTFAGYDIYQNGDSSLSISGDLRLRLENDWDSVSGNGAEREDRARLRTRARVRLDAQIDKEWRAVFRLRSGSDDSQQSPHITLFDFDDNDTGDADFNFDLWYGQYQANGLTVWAGRNQPNFWRQDEFIIDDDVTTAGMGATYDHDFAAGQLSWQGGFGSMPAGMRDFSSQYVTAQIVYTQDSERNGFTVAAGYLGVDGDADDPDGALLLTDNNSRDYATGIVQAQWRLKTLSQPLKLAVTAGHNFEDYDNEPIDSFSEFHKDDTDFFVAFVNWGSSNQPGDWLFGYYYAHIEALAFSSSYAQDDWVRWGNATQTRATNMKGSEFRAVYKLAGNMDIVSRLYLADAVELLNAGDVAKEDGKRARIDFNLKF